MKLLGNGGVRTISPKKHELWQFVEVDGHRKQKTRTFRGGKVEARAALRAFQSELADIVPTSDTFAAYTASWCAWRRECGRYSNSTCKNYESVIRALNDYVGNMPLAEITPTECKQVLMDAKRNRKLSGTTLSSYYAVLHGLFEAAVKDKVIATNPMKAVERPKKDTKERTALSPAELDELWERVERQPLNAQTMAVFLAIDLGLRIGECLWLETKDVGKSQLKVTRSKTSAGSGRVLPMTSRLAAKCREWEAERQRRGIADAPNFCCRPTGAELFREQFHYWYKRNKNTFEGPSHFHDLRHSNLSKMARFMSTHDLQRWAGWSSLEMAQRYVHDDYTQLEHAVSRAECWGNVGESGERA